MAGWRRELSAEPGWWQDYGDILSEPVEMLSELEVEASWIRSWERATSSPSLLQTRDYAERIIIITASSSHMRVADNDRYLELRMRRQKRLAEGIRFTTVCARLRLCAGPGTPAPGVPGPDPHHHQGATP